jgi:hypothetical protein
MKIIKIIVLAVIAFLMFVNGLGLPSVHLSKGDISVWQSQELGTGSCPEVIGSYNRGSPFSYMGFEYSGCSLTTYFNFIGVLLDIVILAVIGYLLFMVI